MVGRGAALLLVAAGALSAQPRQEPGKPIGTVTTQGNLIVMTLDENALGKSNLFDLARKTLAFTPESGGFRVATGALEWDSDFGPELTASDVKLHNFAFPFSGKSWDSLSVGVTGSVRFGDPQPGQGPGGGGGFGGRGGGVSIARFDQLREAARNLVNTVPAICVFFKPRMSGKRYVKELADRVVITWDITEPYGNIQDFTWVPTINRFQAVLHRNGTIRMSYDQLAARDAIVGVYPLLTGAPRELASVENVRIESVGGTLLRITFPSAGMHRVTLRPAKGDPVVWAARTPSIQRAVPAEWKSGDRITVSIDNVSNTITLPELRSPEVHLSALKSQDGPFPVVYESFHYLQLPNPRDLTCTVLKSLGDKFDFLAYYSDFRIDNQEAGTPSNGPLGGHVTGIGQLERGLESYCSQGRFQWQFIQPVYAGANQMQAYRPDDLPPDPSNHNIGFYTKQLGEQASDGRMLPYNYAISQIGHEMGHRWSAFVSAKVNGETIPLGPTHWARGLQAPVAFPYQRPTEASAMGGSVWQDNFDATYTQLDDDYYVPAAGWSYLDLYLMGLIAPEEVPDFFILRNLVPAGPRSVKADRTKITINDVIAAEGPRTPGVQHSQRKFNTGMVVVVEHGKIPSKELLDRTNAIAARWVDYFSVTTGRRASMTTIP